MINTKSLKNRWLVLSTFIISITYVLFASLLIYFTSIYLQEQEYRSVDRAMDELETLFTTEPYNTIKNSDIYTSLYDRQKMILYSSSGEEVYSRTTGIPGDVVPEFKIANRQTVENWEYQGESYLVSRAPITSPFYDGYLTVIHPLEPYKAVISMMAYIAIVIGFAFVILTMIISYFFSIQMVRPIASIAKQLKHVEQNGFSERLVENTGAQETDYMVQAFNSMMSTLEDSFNQQKQFVEDASHELRTPLQIIHGHLNLIARWGRDKPEVLDESLNISIEELKRINKLVEELLQLTKNDGEAFLELEEIEVNTELTNRVHAFKHVNPDYKFELNLSDSDIYFNINRHHFDQMLTIFIDNAIKYDKLRKKIELFTEKTSNSIVIKIKDNGLGIPKDDIDSIFNRFYRVDKSRSRQEGGNGLGLSIAKKLIETYRGTVHAKSEEGKYTVIIIEFKL